MSLHELKCWPENYTPLQYGEKTAEFRKNDRNFAVRDFLFIREWEPEKKRYTGEELVAQIVAMDEGFGIPDGYAMLSIRVLGLKH